MNRLMVAILTVTAGMAASCSSGIKSQSLFDPDYTRFKEIKTYNQKPLVKDPTVPEWALKHAQYMVDRIMTHERYKKSDTPDVWINVHGARSTFVDSTDYGYDEGYTSPDNDWLFWNRSHYEWLKTRGSLMLDMVDAQTNVLIWRAAAESESSANLTQGQMEQKIEQAVAKMLKEFPPKK